MPDISLLGQAGWNTKTSTLNEDFLFNKAENKSVLVSNTQRMEDPILTHDKSVLSNSGHQP